MLLVFGRLDVTGWGRRIVVVVAAGALSMAVGCGGGEDEIDDAGGGSTTSSPVSLSVDPSESTMGTPPPGVVPEGALTESALPPVAYDDDAAPEDRLAAIAETAREYEMPEVADALADGEVTVAERRQAYQDTLDCMVEQGMEVVQFEEYDGLYGTEFTYIIGWGALSQEEASRVDRECFARYLFLWNLVERIVAGERFTDRTRAVLQECLAEHGVTDDVGYTMGELQEVAPSQEVVLECTTRAEDKPKPPPEVMGGGPPGR